MKPITIVIYEDNDFLRTSLQDSLSLLSDLQVIGTFGTCHDVVEQITALKPNVVLMDIGLPGINGLEGLKLIRKHIPGTLVMMLTVFEDNDNIFEAICNGASGYLLKSASTQKIIESIRDLVSGGAPMTPSIAKKVLLLFHKLTLPAEDQYGLSLREKEVLDLLTSGFSYKMIAEKCFISLETVRSHIKKIYEKLQVHSATEAASKILIKKYTL